MEKICFIVNSQKKKLDQLKTSIKKRFQSYYEVGFLYTTGYRNAETLTQTAVQLGYTTLIAVGGDGTVNEIVNGLYQLPEKARKGIVVGVLPWGTGNDFARTIGAASTVEELFSQIRDAKHMPIDIVKVTYTDESAKTSSRYFNNIADIGIGPDTLITVGKISKWVGGTLAFSIAAVKALFFLKPHHITLNTDSKQFDGAARCVCIANGRYFGSGLGIAPLAKINDGFINLVVIEDVTPFDFIRLVDYLRKAKPISHPKVHYITTKTCTIKANNRELPMEVDGEVVGYAPLHAEVIPAAIRFIGNICSSTHAPHRADQQKEEVPAV